MAVGGRGDVGRLVEHNVRARGDLLLALVRRGVLRVGRLRGAAVALQRAGSEHHLRQLVAGEALGVFERNRFVRQR